LLGFLAVYLGKIPRIEFIEILGVLLFINAIGFFFQPITRSNIIIGQSVDFESCKNYNESFICQLNVEIYNEGDGTASSLNLIFIYEGTQIPKTISILKPQQSVSFILNVTYPPSDTSFVAYGSYYEKGDSRRIFTSHRLQYYNPATKSIITPPPLPGPDFWNSKEITCWVEEQFNITSLDCVLFRFQLKLEKSFNERIENIKGLFNYPIFKEIEIIWRNFWSSLY
jgi:hypothetical protein